MFRNSSKVLDQGGKPATGLGAAVSMWKGPVRTGAYVASVPKADTYKPVYHTDASVRRLTTITPTSIALTMGTLEAREAFETFGLVTERDAGINVIRAQSREALVYGRMDNLNQALDRHAARIRSLVAEYNRYAEAIEGITGQPQQKLDAKNIIGKGYGMAMGYLMASTPYGWVIGAMQLVFSFVMDIFEKKRAKKRLREYTARLTELANLLGDDIKAFEVYRKDLDRLDKSMKAGLPDVSLTLKRETAIYRPGKKRVFIDPTGVAPAQRTAWIDSPKLAVGTQQLFIKGVEAPVFVRKEAPRKVSDIKPLTTKIAVYGGILGACPRDRWGN